MSELVIRNRQRTRALNGPLLRRIIRHVLEKELNAASYELGFHFVPPDEMARVNGRFLQHEGSTDVITFDYGFREAWGREVQNDSAVRFLSGEIFICIADAVIQAREFRTTWQSEVIRYVIHGVLHLRGYDDLPPAKRCVMKREENRLVKRVASQFALEQLARTRNPKLKTRKTC